MKAVDAPARAGEYLSLEGFVLFIIPLLAATPLIGGAAEYTAIWAV
jgi:hypothetical protein